MKKVVIGLVTLGILIGNSTSSLAQEKSQTSATDEGSLQLVPRLEMADDSIETATTTQSSFELELAPKTTETLATGVFGTVPWEWEETTRTLTFGGGAFPATNEKNNIKTLIQALESIHD